MQNLLYSQPMSWTELVTSLKESWFWGTAMQTAQNVEAEGYPGVMICQALFECNQLRTETLASDRSFSEDLLVSSP